MNEAVRKIYIDPSWPSFHENGLFKVNDPIQNRDDQLLPFDRLRSTCAANNTSVDTADILMSNPVRTPGACDYYSLGILDHFETVLKDRLARLAAFVIMEPPIVCPILYQSLPRLTEVFEKVYVNNTSGDGYSLLGVDQSKLYRFYWPIPHRDVVQPYWGNRERLKKIVVINSNHNPRGRSGEQYSHRIDAMTTLSRIGVVDLYGKKWRKWWKRSAMWLPYWRNRKALLSIYQGSCSSKFETLSKYEFCLCYENMAMNGYITEKIFDCLYSGTIPLYKGAPDILNYVPADVFIDCRKYPTVGGMWDDIAAMPDAAISKIRDAGQAFLKSDYARRFYDSMLHICDV